MRRDPEGRRRTIVRAAMRVIAEVGRGQVTHRLIAARAEVPLGSTTYYFPTLDDLVVTAMREATEDARAQLEAWAEELMRSDDQVTTLVDLIAGYLADREQALLEYELYLAAARAPDLRPSAALWLDGLRGICSRLAGGYERGVALAALVDGALLQALVTGDPLDTEGLRAGVAGLVSPRTTAGST
ncbi:TetR/AcrR family transcriptional regulator [Actinophytocola gossypii]|uniref:TetR family transcriptional regulator n=1 Tax=Actinophytocola gossypii TaxID=2812003 RepID=A0ABT2J7X5_9PSEU|nr:TetR family transcriptional regulator [Actinophytocola gossypii]MCT2583389.1 TetR family transcriptional regulator [Actinophytocola gossypii]